MITENISTEKLEQLSHQIVDSWDMDTLIEFALDKVEVGLMSLSDEEFNEEYERFFNDR
tara:strand:- start:25428 stop:25604 length:177 start_codon:yes stop_codon:yes gene_type:complete